MVTPIEMTLLPVHNFIGCNARDTSIDCRRSPPTVFPFNSDKDPPAQAYSMSDTN
jgi:hypothetical protein